MSQGAASNANATWAATTPTATTRVENDWQQAHEQLMRLARARAGFDFEEGCWLLRAWRGDVHVRLGFGSFREYVERLFGYGGRLVQEKLRVAEALEGLPQLAAALQTGALCWSAVRELTRVATADTETAWLRTVETKTAKEVERLVSGRILGSLPGDPRELAAIRHVLRFEVTSDVLAIVREAIGKLRRDAGERIDDEAALLLMARTVLEGPDDDGRASYQVAITTCESCGHATQQGQGEAVDVGPEILKMAQCDAQHVGAIHVHAHAGAKVGPATQTIPPAVRRLVLRRDLGRCAVPGCRHSTWVDVHHIAAKGEGGGHEPDNLVTLCGAHHRAVHRGVLIVERPAGERLTFRHADGSTYGHPLSPASVEAGAKAFRALRGLGFAERDVRWALSQVTHVGSDESVEGQVRSCLAVLTNRLARAS